MKKNKNVAPKQHPDLSVLRHILPLLSRKHPKFQEWTGYSPRSFANMDSLHETNTIKKVMFGGAVAYESQSLIDWLEQRSYVIE